MLLPPCRADESQELGTLASVLAAALGRGKRERQGEVWETH